MKPQPLLALALLTAALAGCASRPEDIRPAYVSEASFRSLSPAQMLSRQEYLIDQLRTACAEQDSIRATDSALCILGGPPSLLVPKTTAERIAQLKGELLALRSAAEAAGVALPVIDVDKIASQRRT